MAMTRPVTDLRDHFADITRLAHETAEPMLLTDSDKGELVLMSREALEDMFFKLEVDLKLRQSELEEKSGVKLYSMEEVYQAMIHETGGE